MPTRNVNLTDEQDAFVEEIVRSGRYQNASEAMRGLQQRLKADALKLDLLRTQVKAGIEALDRGAFTQVDDADLDGTLDRLANASRLRAWRGRLPAGFRFDREEANARSGGSAAKPLATTPGRS